MPPLWAIIAGVALCGVNFAIGYYGSHLRRTGTLREKPPVPVACPTCPHPHYLHNAFGCTALFCGCERTWIGAGWP